MGTHHNRHPDRLDVELVRYPPIRGVLGSVGKDDGGWIAVAVLDTDWRESGRGDTVDPDDPVVRVAAYLAINEHGDEPPFPVVEAQGSDHYRIHPSYFAKAEAALE